MTQLTTTEVHNVYTFYCLDDDGRPVEQPILSTARPQDWGDKNRWNYTYFKIEFSIANRNYINHAHCWIEDQTVSEQERLKLFAPIAVDMCLVPGWQKELCGTTHLAENDFWEKSWGQMPPYFEAQEQDDWEEYSQ